MQSLANSYQELLDEFGNKDLKSVGNYTLGRLIGKGSFGKVYLATHKLTNGSKVVLKSADKNDSNLAREIHHHRQFVHPHIARLYEVVVTETMVWLVLEYCSGDELYDYLLKHGPLPVEKVQKIFTQLVGAVVYVHMQACVHRDLKLENILFDKHENVKLVDFGFTREYEGKSNHLQTFCGTVCYSAPEMLKGEKYAGEKVDVWSLGIILYALLCGELPFDDDDDNVTRTKILSEEPKYSDHLPADAVSLIKLLLSKRPFRRPALPDILSHPFLAEHAPHQQAILKLEKPAPFSTPLEKETLHRMKSAGVDIDTVIESVLAQRCDPLAGWWTLLLEKEERKHKRRERKRKEKDAEKRISRRLSGASSRLGPVLHEVDEEGGLTGNVLRLRDPPPPRTRGRTQRRSGHFPGDFTIADLQRFTAAERAKGNLSPESEVPPPPIDKDSVRSVSSTRQRRPIPPPKEGVLRSARSRGSTLHLVATGEALHAPTESEPTQKVKKKPSQALLAHWKSWTNWIVESTKRGRNPRQRRGSQSTPNLVTDKTKTGSGKLSKDPSPRPHTSKYPNSGGSQATTPGASTPGATSNGNILKAPGGATGPFSSPLSGTLSTPSGPVPRMPSSRSYKRQSLSPSPLTPRSTMRRGSGLRGRKSTSSSVSSIRSIHKHHHTHSKASSTSSNGSVSTAMSKSTLQAGRSPHHSVKVLPATPTGNAFPPNLRLVRGPPLAMFNEGMPSAMAGPSGNPPGSPNPFSGGSVLFAKRKRNLFKGPTLGGPPPRSSSGSHSRSASASGLGRRSGEMAIQEEDEEEYATEEDLGETIEEVDHFSPVHVPPGVMVETKIYEEGEPITPAPPMTPMTVIDPNAPPRPDMAQRRPSETAIPVGAG
ncbi:hypothetical protein MKZ38_005397 [Zalerion maritima]|uniref:Protein kinase domain-containing protein n=1 Tax=Zalerion maritima TaxID=339359 RepID=A0AAD5RKR3_9PEZI|nr:hypothetical protein MKZ38_005397 [Zalerion maritima]